MNQEEYIKRQEEVVNKQRELLDLWGGQISTFIKALGMMAENEYLEDSGQLPKYRYDDFQALTKNTPKNKKPRKPK